VKTIFSQAGHRSLGDATLLKYTFYLLTYLLAQRSDLMNMPYVVVCL